MAKYRIVKDVEGWPWLYSAEEYQTGLHYWSFVSGTVAMTKWGAKRALLKYLANEKEKVLEEFEA